MSDFESEEEFGLVEHEIQGREVERIVQVLDGHEQNRMVNRLET